LKSVNYTLLRAADGEALGAVAGGHVRVERAAARELGVAVVGVVAAVVVDVEIDVVRVGLPVEDESDRRVLFERRPRLAQAREDRPAARWLALDPGCGDEAEILAQDAI